MTKTRVFAYIDMTVLDHNDSSHSLKVIPRYYNVDNTHTLELYNEDTEVETTETIDSRSLADGYITYDFTKTVEENDSYTYKITDATTTKVVSRGRIFVTDQTTQNYSING